MMNKQQITVMVVGGCGFVGSHLVDYWAGQYNVEKVIIVDNLFLHSVGHILPWWANPKVIFYKGDASDKNTMEHIFMKDDVDIVYNTGVMPLLHSLAKPAINYNNNVGIVLNLLELLKDKLYRRLIHFSSSEVYGSCQIEPMDENHPYKPSTVYAVSKHACDDLIDCYYNLYHLPVAILRPFNLYGTRQNDNSYAAIIPRTIKRLMQGEPAQVYGSGNQTRDYTYVDDVVRAAAMMYEQWGKCEGETFVVASGKETRIKDLVEMICDIYYRETKSGNVRIEYLPARNGDVARHIGCGDKIKRVLGFEPLIFLASGLVNTIKYYMHK